MYQGTSVELNDEEETSDCFESDPLSLTGRTIKQQIQQIMCKMIQVINNRWWDRDR